MKLLNKLTQSQKIVSLPPTASVQEAAKLMAERNVGSVIVMEGDRLAGIFTERDVLNRVISKAVDPARTPLSRVMSSQVVTVDINDSIDSCFDRMQERKTRHVPIMDGEKIVGMVTMRNILEWLWKEIEEENLHLKEYIQQA